MSTQQQINTWKEALAIQMAKKAEQEKVLVEDRKIQSSAAASMKAIDVKLLDAVDRGDPKEIAELTRQRDEFENVEINAKLAADSTQRSIDQINGSIKFNQTQLNQFEKSVPAQAIAPSTLGDQTVNSENNGATVPVSISPEDQPAEDFEEQSRLDAPGYSDEPVNFDEDPSAEQADENGGFVIDPNTGEMVPGDSGLATSIREAQTVEDFEEQSRLDAVPYDQEPIDPPKITATWDPETGSWGLFDENQGVFIQTGLSEQEAKLQAEEMSAGFGVQERPNPQQAVDDFDEQSRADAEAYSEEPIQVPVPKELPPPPAPKDWRVRISLAPGSNYLYNSSENAGILSPLKTTGGVIFPYTPSINITYSAKYDSLNLTHTNYAYHNYSHSSVESIGITADFTAQDVNEAAYMLAVIHFFRSASKMFYGKDQNPNRGTPPPLLYLSGHGNYQFDNHPMVLTSFAYSLPPDVDYINAYPNGSNALNSIQLSSFTPPKVGKSKSDKLMKIATDVATRLTGANLNPGGAPLAPIFLNQPAGSNVVTRVPTKISIQLTFLPIVTRNAVTNKFSLEKYASGELLRGSQNPGTGGGMW